MVIALIGMNLCAQGWSCQHRSRIIIPEIGELAQGSGKRPANCKLEPIAHAKSSARPQTMVDIACVRIHRIMYARETSTPRARADKKSAI